LTFGDWGDTDSGQELPATEGKRIGETKAFAPPISWMVDAAGTTTFTYHAGGQLATDPPSPAEIAFAERWLRWTGSPSPVEMDQEKDGYGG
jgi:hypothetical protein